MIRFPAFATNPQMLWGMDARSRLLSSDIGFTWTP